MRGINLTNYIKRIWANRKPALDMEDAAAMANQISASLPTMPHYVWATRTFYSNAGRPMIAVGPIHKHGGDVYGWYQCRADRIPAADVILDRVRKAVCYAKRRRYRLIAAAEQELAAINHVETELQLERA